MILQQYSNDILKNKASILEYLMGTKEIKEILEFYEIPSSAFIQEYSSPLIDLYIDVINECSLSEDDKKMTFLISNCKKNCIKDYDIFKIIKSVKYAISDYFEKISPN